MEHQFKVGDRAYHIHWRSWGTIVEVKNSTRSIDIRWPYRIMINGQDFDTQDASLLSALWKPGTPDDVNNVRVMLKNGESKYGYYLDDDYPGDEEGWYTIIKPDLSRLKQNLYGGYIGQSEKVTPDNPVVAWAELDTETEKSKDELPAFWHEGTPDDPRNVRVMLEGGKTAWGWYGDALMGFNGVRGVWSTSDEKYSEKIENHGYGYHWDDATEKIVAWAEIEDWFDAEEKKSEDHAPIVKPEEKHAHIGFDASYYDTAVRLHSDLFKNYEPAPVSDPDPIDGKKSDQGSVVLWNNGMVSARFLIDEPNVFVCLTRDDEHDIPRIGYAQCHTGEKFDRYEGMKRAMRRACKIGEKDGRSGDYQEFRQWLKEQKNAEPVESAPKDNDGGWTDCETKLPSNTGSVEIVFSGSKMAPWFAYYDGLGITGTGAKWNVTDYDITHTVTVDDCGKTHPAYAKIGKWRKLSAPVKVKNGEVVK